MSDISEYVVRGAEICCNYGSHPRKLNLPVSHGSFVNGQPMMNETDCKPEVNISHFGICNHPANTSGEQVYLILPNGTRARGKPCQLLLTGEPWTRTKATVKVDGQSALTTQSLLFCTVGGNIRFINSGQHEGTGKDAARNTQK